MKLTMHNKLLGLIFFALSTCFSPVAHAANPAAPAATSSSDLAGSLNANGLWWNPQESGWGMSLTQRGQMIFVAWFTYDGQGNPVWYVASSCPVSGNACTGELYRVIGGTAPTEAWDSTYKILTPVGTINLAFTDNDNAIATYTLNGANGSRAITRQVF